ncbi:hypothetical protein [Allobranchiibius huperziae]|uniref:Uncharacterized protein n=1 Tax=Allobranchiibius huperziae TaxID=1874116 RepID=A0A853DM16_9MICO|nr:hypothetical protein [Allobranchiibius huperziae]NYJ75670.1 hypothetical protein [Allobranchiibius huperziae]
MSASDESDWLPFYLRDHFAGATAGVQLFDRVANGHSDETVREEVAQLRVEVGEDRSALGSMMTALRIRQLSLTMLVGMLGEYAGRLKPNGALLQRSSGSDVFELETLSSAVQAKSRVWETLLVLAEHDSRLDPERLQQLLDRAEDQRQRLGDLHARFLQQLIGR